VEITFLGMNCVRITGKDLAILCDPYPKSAGLGEIKLGGDATLLTLPGAELPLKAGMVIDSPGEYEIKGAAITGVPARPYGAAEPSAPQLELETADAEPEGEEESEEDAPPPAPKPLVATTNVAAIYSLAIDGARVVYLGNVAPKLSDQQIEALGQVDVLILPVGGQGQTAGATEAAGLISQLEPKYVVPTHYDDGKTKYAGPQDKLDLFLKEVGASPEPQPKLRVTTKDLPLETTVVALSRQGS
jgi:L-ascorbate metabolism protein UlaG (beta-lactamase superfamily)